MSKGSSPSHQQRVGIGAPPPTMRDIAIAAGVSRSTVSRVLNKAETRVPIGEETRTRVLAAAKALGYRPNPLARGLRGAPTMVLGAVVKDFSDPFFAAAIEALAVAAQVRGYNVLIGHAHGRDEAVALATVLETSLTDAIVLLGDMQDQPGLLAELRASPVPVIATWQGISKLEFATVDVDDRAGMRKGLDHLIDLGHERIALVSAALPGANTLREDAYEDILTERFGAIPEGYLQRVPNTLAGGAAALEALRLLPNPPTAVAATTDLVAVGVLHHAWSLGWAVPEQLSVVGYDDLYIAPHTVPPLTTIRMPLTEITDTAVRLAVELAHNRTSSRERSVMRFEPSLVVRLSTCPVRRSARTS